MLKLTLAGAALLSALVVPLAQGAFAGRANTGLVEQRLLHQMNSGPAGHVTRRVDCRPHAGLRFACVLLSSRSTRLDARVVLRGGELQTVWAPLKG
jgi:hypothetical protein